MQSISEFHALADRLPNSFGVLFWLGCEFVLASLVDGGSGFSCLLSLTVLCPGKNDWVCIPGDQNLVGHADMTLDPMGMVWFKDLLARKPKPTNTSPGLIYMLNGATQRSFTDPFDTTSPPIPIGPHWMILWPFDAKAAGLSTIMRDGGTMVMFAGTPYAHLHICGSPWEGNEYRGGDRGIWTMKYEGP
jgi:hypothetical protein